MKASSYLLRRGPTKIVQEGTNYGESASRCPCASIDYIRCPYSSPCIPPRSRPLHLLSFLYISESQAHRDEAPQQVRDEY